MFLDIDLLRCIHIGYLNQLILNFICLPVLRKISAFIFYFFCRYLEPCIDIFLTVAWLTCVTCNNCFPILMHFISVMLFCRKDILLMLLHIVIQASSAKSFLSSCIRLKSLWSTVTCKAVNCLCMKI
jgi:hypothetical protein